MGWNYFWRSIFVFVSIFTRFYHNFCNFFTRIFSLVSYQIKKDWECWFRNIFIPLCPTKTISWHCILMVWSHVLWLIMRSMHFKLKVKKVQKWDISKMRHFWNCILNVLKLVTDLYWSLFLKMVFCYQNCSDLLWEKIVLVIEKNFWNLQNVRDH